jgi:cell division protease FtsH
MITRWGMGTLGPVAFHADDEQPFLGYQLAQGRDYSDETMTRIDQEVQHLLAERQQVVRNLLAGARQKLDGLAEALLREETITAEGLTELLGPRPRVSEEHVEPESPVSQGRPH